MVHGQETGVMSPESEVMSPRPVARSQWLVVQSRVGSREFARSYLAISIHRSVNGDLVAGSRRLKAAGCVITQLLNLSTSATSGARISGVRGQETRVNEEKGQSL